MPYPANAAIFSYFSLDGIFKFFYICSNIMIESQYLKFYNYFGKRRRFSVEGVLGKNSENGEGANESLPFFVGGGGDVREINWWKCVDEIIEKVVII
jgi:hypothetical protein